MERGSIDRESPPSCEISLDGDSQTEQEIPYEEPIEVYGDGGGAAEPQEDAREDLGEYNEGYADEYCADLDDGHELGGDDEAGFDDGFADDYEGGNDYYDDY